ncbi:hypothetical protein [Thalassospira alkalitolerans]|uniref:hypothetical protein n=1 Tax=Thalassospira alkalitolerans TaxID=1293890 RepID=UPI003AA9D632
MRRSLLPFIVGVLIAFGLFAQAACHADDGNLQVQVGITIQMDADWYGALTDAQQPFFRVLREKPEFQIAQGIPYPRMIEMVNSHELDCAVDRVPEPLGGKIASREGVVFELILYV